VHTNRHNQQRRALSITLSCAVICLVLPTLLTACVDTSQVTVRKEKMYPQKHTLDATNAPKSEDGQKDPSEQVVEHEDGHVRICRLFYRDAVHQARKCALHVLGREYTGEAKDEQTAEKLAIEAASKEMSACYAEKIVQPAIRASEAYDKLTAQGANQLPVPEAIDKAIADAQ
jgi:hypothetical protein